MTISPNNPTGAVYPRALTAVNELCREAGIYHISDEAYEYFVVRRRHAFFARLDRRRRRAHDLALFAVEGVRLRQLAHRLHGDSRAADGGGAQSAGHDPDLPAGDLAGRGRWRLAGRAGLLPAQGRAEWHRCGTWCSTSSQAVRRFCTIPPALGAFLFLAAASTPARLDGNWSSGSCEFGVAVIPGTTFGLEAGLHLRVAYGALDADTIAEGIGTPGARLEIDREGALIAMQIVGCQLDIAWEDKPANSRTACARCWPPRRSSRARWSCCPRCSPRASACTSTRLPSRTTVRRTRFWPSWLGSCELVLAGVVTRGADGRGRNEAVVYRPPGQKLVRYCKMHPFSFAGETKHYEAGEGITLFEWRRFQGRAVRLLRPAFPGDLSPRGARGRRAAGGDRQLAAAARVALAGPAAVPERSKTRPTWWASTEQAAIRTCPTAGRSLIVEPAGRDLGRGGRQEQAGHGRDRSGPLVEYRQQFPALADMRADLFGE